MLEEVLSAMFLVEEVLVGQVVEEVVVVLEEVLVIRFVENRQAPACSP